MIEKLNAAELLAQALMNSNFANENIHFAKFDTISIRHFAVSTEMQIRIILYGSESYISF